MVCKKQHTRASFPKSTMQLPETLHPMLAQASSSDASCCFTDAFSIS